MKYVKWLFVVLFVCSFISFVDKDKVTGGWNVGDKAPIFMLPAKDGNQALSLKDLRGEYVLLSFWAGYDAPSRMSNLRLCQALRDLDKRSVRMVSVSFDKYASVFAETIREDGIDPAVCFVDVKGEASGIFKKYRLKKGFRNYLLNDKGVIIAKDVTAENISEYLP